MNTALEQYIKIISSGSIEDIMIATNIFIASHQDFSILFEAINVISSFSTDQLFKKCSIALVIQKLHALVSSIFQQNPDDPYLARCVAACSDSPVLKNAYFAYAQALEGECITPVPLLRPPLPPGVRPLRVTFIADYVSPRVTRHMACAKQGGMAVQGIFKIGPAPYTTLDPNIYDSLVLYQSSSKNIDAIIQATTAFDADIVHLPTHLHVNETALTLTCSLPFPIVGDAYDLINIIFNKDTIVKNHFEAQLALERGWFRNVDGLCMRSRVIHFAEKCGMLRKGTRAIYFPETCLNHGLEHARFSESDDKVHCIITGTMDYTFGECLSQLAPFIKDSNIVIHILPTYYEKGKNNPEIEKIRSMIDKYSFIKLHNTKSHLEYFHFLRKMDVLIDGIFIELPIYDRQKTGESHAAIYSMGNRICDALEQDVIIMVSPLYKDRARLASVANRAIIVRRNELMSNTFWCDLKNKVDIVRQTQRNLDKLSPPFQSNRLKRFYYSVIQQAAKRRGFRPHLA